MEEVSEHSVLSNRLATDKDPELKPENFLATVLLANDRGFVVEIVNFRKQLECRA